MILPNDITNLKTDITDKIGQKIIVKGTLGRSRFFEKEATIEKTYPNLFVVKYDDEERFEKRGIGNDAQNEGTSMDCRCRGSDGRVGTRGLLPQAENL